jgi:hypothetical protein
VWTYVVGLRVTEEPYENALQFLPRFSPVLLGPWQLAFIYVLCGSVAIGWHLSWSNGTNPVEMKEKRESDQAEDLQRLLHLAKSRSSKLPVVPEEGREMV